MANDDVDDDDDDNDSKQIYVNKSFKTHCILLVFRMARHVRAAPESNAVIHHSALNSFLLFSVGDRPYVGL